MSPLNRVNHRLQWRSAWRWLPALALATLASPCSVSAQGYQISWHQIGSGGGGGGGSGGGFGLYGSVGQPAAGAPLKGGPFALTGGFMSGFVPPGIPALRIVSSGRSAVISWFPPKNGFNLQTTDSLAPPAWHTMMVGAKPPVTIPVTGAMRYFRLSRP